MKELIKLSELKYSIKNVINKAIFENIFIDKEDLQSFVNSFSDKGKSNEIVYFIYKDVKIKGTLTAIENKNDYIAKTNTYNDGNIWGFYPIAQDEFFWAHFDRYQEIKKEMLTKYYVTESTRHKHLGVNALRKTLIQLIDEVNLTKL